MNTKYTEIVNTNAIGKAENPITLNQLLKRANDEQLIPSRQNRERVLFIGIDVQQDFMEKGALGVPGAHGDVERMTRFIYENMDAISNIAVSIDTHTPHQIFHPCWWIDEQGSNPAPYTTVTLADLDSGKWKAVINPIASRDYVGHLEQDGKRPSASGHITAFREQSAARWKTSLPTWSISTLSPRKPSCSGLSKGRTRCLRCTV